MFVFVSLWVEEKKPIYWNGLFAFVPHCGWRKTIICWKNHCAIEFYIIILYTMTFTPLTTKLTNFCSCSIEVHFKWNNSSGHVALASDTNVFGGLWLLWLVQLCISSKQVMQCLSGTSRLYEINCCHFLLLLCLLKYLSCLFSLRTQWDCCWSWTLSRILCGIILMCRSVNS